MFIDARTLPDKSTFEVDLAIIGAGPAGITLATRLASTKLTVCLIESGGLEPDAKVQSLYEGENRGIDYPLSGSRLRYLGGSSNHWAGFCRPLDPIDFETRAWVPHSGWPFSIAELTPYYESASQWVEIAPGRFNDTDYWQDKTGESPLPQITHRLQTRFVHFSPPTRFGTHYRNELAQPKNVRVLLNANVVNIAATQNARAVTQLDIRTLNARSHTVKARSYVLATGGLENARMLLLSNNIISAGLGNQHDLVGRFFMEHPHLSGFGEIVVADIERIPRFYRERIPADGRSAHAALNAADAFLRRRRLLNASFMMAIASYYQTDTKPTSAQHNADTHIKMLKAAKPFIYTAKNSPNRQRDKNIGVWMGLGCSCEQIPNPNSRVSLSKKRDALGLPKIRLDWRLTEQDRRSIVEHMRSLAFEFGAQNIGRMMLNAEDDGRWPEHINGGNHHMGTTRMHDDPKQGVVDRNQRVHDMENLYIAGSSVFPTSGAANPTLTIVAMTLRLADHLENRLL